MIQRRTPLLAVEPPVQPEPRPLVPPNSRLVDRAEKQRLDHLGATIAGGIIASQGDLVDRAQPADRVEGRMVAYRDTGSIEKRRGLFDVLFGVDSGAVSAEATHQVRALTFSARRVQRMVRTILVEMTKTDDFQLPIYAQASVAQFVREVKRLYDPGTLGRADPAVVLELDELMESIAWDTLDFVSRAQSRSKALAQKAQAEEGCSVAPSEEKKRVDLGLKLTRAVMGCTWQSLAASEPASNFALAAQTWIHNLPLEGKIEPKEVLALARQLRRLSQAGLSLKDIECHLIYVRRSFDRFRKQGISPSDRALAEDISDRTEANYASGILDRNTLARIATRHLARQRVVLVEGEPLLSGQADSAFEGAEPPLAHAMTSEMLKKVAASWRTETTLTIHGHKPKRLAVEQVCRQTGTAICTLGDFRGEFRHPVGSYQRGSDELEGLAQSSEYRQNVEALAKKYGVSFYLAFLDKVRRIRSAKVWVEGPALRALKEGQALFVSKDHPCLDSIRTLASGDALVIDGKLVGGFLPHPGFRLIVTD